MSEFEWVAIAAVVVLSSARLTRLVTYDHFPPVKWLREKYIDATDGSDWQLLAMCGYCASFWISLIVLLWGYATDFDTVWWIINSALGGSYLAAIVMVHDGDPGDDGDED